MDEEARAPRRRALTVVAVLVLALACLAWGIGTARVTASVGPHTARYDVTLDSTVTVDLGPLGTVRIDSPVPGPLGARVVVQEIPTDLTALGSADTVDQLGEDLQAYVQFFSGPATTVEHVVRDLMVDAALRTLGAAATVVLGWFALRALLGPRRRRELADAAQAHQGRLVTAGGLVVALLLVPGADPEPTPVAVRGAVVFQGTPLEGARITGRLAGIVDTYGGMLLSEIRANEAFYAGATEAVRRDWARHPADDGAADPGSVTLLLVSDLHCNVGMAGVIGVVADLAGADLVLDAGDTTVNGTIVESYCAQAVADALPDGVTQVVAGGNHDSPETASQHRAVGAVVLAGEVVAAGGLTILGDRDFQITRIGVGTTLAGPETMSQMATRLAEAACAEPDGVDVLLVHQPALAQEVLASGCVTTALSGHMHRREGPVLVGEAARYTSSSTAGAVLGGATIGPLNGAAEMTVLHLDPETGAVRDWRLVTVRPDGTVTVSDTLPWPRPVPPELRRPDPPAGTPW